VHFCVTSVINRAQSGILIVDAHGYTSKLNSDAEKLFGYRKGQLREKR
jgi:sensor histidine kinase regulating citrate/malate metabolism